MSRGEDPNIIKFSLQCMVCGKNEFSQGDLKIHHKESPCKFLVQCGCCSSVFSERKVLASHLNMPGVRRRDPFLLSAAASVTSAAVLLSTDESSVPLLSSPSVCRSVCLVTSGPTPGPEVLGFRLGQGECSAIPWHPTIWSQKGNRK